MDEEEEEEEKEEVEEGKKTIMLWKASMPVELIAVALFISRFACPDSCQARFRNPFLNF